MIRIVTIIFVLFAGISAIAQEVPKQYDKAFEFYYSNDVSGSSDKYYTNGVGFAYTAPIFSKSPFNPGWLKKTNQTRSYHTITFTYDVFTPDLNKELYTDRPFSAVMMLGSKHQYVLANNTWRLTSEMQLGLIGQATGAGKLQNGLHEIMPGADRVEGWDTQIRNDLAVNYIFGADKQLHRSDFAEIIGSANAYLGVPYTKLETGILLRMGILEDYFDNLLDNAKREWQAYLSTGIKSSFIAYNGTLQGGLLNSNNPYVLTDIEHVVLDMHLGLNFAYRNTSLGLSQHFITPEFNGGVSHSWGDLRLIIRF